MRLSQAGIAGAVVLLGTTITQTQLAWLAQAPAVLLLLDGDQAGRTGAITIARAALPGTRWCASTSFRLKMSLKISPMQTWLPLSNNHLHFSLNPSLHVPGPRSDAVNLEVPR